MSKKLKDNLYKKEREKGYMNTTKLKSGDVVKNYKELCMMLGEEIKSGSSKKAQFKEFERYFQYEKQGQKFLIQNVHETPLPKDDKRKDGNRRVYLTYIENILLPHLSELENGTGYFIKKELWRTLGMVNQFYENLPLKDLLEMDSRMTYWQLQKFYQICSYKLSSILFSSLNSLQSRNLISYEEQYVIVSDSKKRIHIANDKEKKDIAEAEKIILEKMGLSNKLFVASHFKLSEFYSYMSSYVNENFKWDSVYKQYKITLTNNKQYLASTSNKNQIYSNKLLLNEKIIDTVDKYAEKLSKSQNEKLDVIYKDVTDKLKQEDDIWGVIELPDKDSVKKEYKVFTYPNYFVEIQKMLSQKLLKIDNDI